jgi:PAS domain S-box-containing protein
MSNVHQQPEDSSGSPAEENSSGIEERLAYYAHLEENTYDAFIATDENLLVKAWNRGAEMMYGIRAEEALGCDAREVVTLEISDEELASALREIAESGRLEGIDPHRCREVVRERFSAEAMVDGYEKAFEKILALQSGSRVGQKKLATRAAS